MIRRRRIDATAKQKRSGKELEDECDDDDSDDSSDDATSQDSSQTSTDVEGGVPWFYDGAYRRYWDHFRRVRVWMEANRIAAAEARDEAIRTYHFQHALDSGPYVHPFFGWNPSPFDHLLSSNGATTSRERRHRMRKERRKKQKAKKRETGRRRRAEETVDDEEEEEEEEVVNAVDGDFDEDFDQNEAEMKSEGELVAVYENAKAQEDFIKFLAQNREFRKRRDKFFSKDEEAKKKRDQLDSLTPKEQAGSKRADEMLSLYGSDAHSVQCLETKLSMKFDSFVDAFKPPIWPNMPLNLDYYKQ